MSLFTIIIALAVFGVLLWLVNTYIPMDGKIKKIINVVAIIAVILWLLNVFGLLAEVKKIHVNSNPAPISLTA
jgi:hypothetical protein